MPPDERRAAIVAAARPLLVEHGLEFTTRQVAEAAEVAEGTIYRVFDSLTELQNAVLAELIDPEPVVRAVENIDPALSLVNRVEHCIIELRAYAKSSRVLFSVMHRIHQQPTSDTPGKCTKEQLAAARVELLGAICTLLAPDEAHLRLPLQQTAAVVSAATSLLEHPLLGNDYPQDPKTLAELILFGAWKETA